MGSDTIVDDWGGMVEVTIGMMSALGTPDLLFSMCSLIREEEFTSKATRRQKTPYRRECATLMCHFGAHTQADRKEQFF